MAGYCRLQTYTEIDADKSQLLEEALDVGDLNTLVAQVRVIKGGGTNSGAALQLQHAPVLAEEAFEDVGPSISMAEAGCFSQVLLSPLRYVRWRVIHGTGADPGFQVDIVGRRFGTGGVTGPYQTTPGAVVSWADSTGRTTKDNGDLLVDEGGFLFTERPSVSTPDPGNGRFWVKADTPNVPVFTDDSGTDHRLQYWDQALDDIASIAPDEGTFIVGDGMNFGPESDSVARDSLSLGTADNVRFNRLGLGTAPSGSFRLACIGFGLFYSGAYMNGIAGDPLNVSGKGVFWVKNTSPHVPMFSDDGSSHNQLQYQDDVLDDIANAWTVSTDIVEREYTIASVGGTTSDPDDVIFRLLAYGVGTSNTHGGYVGTWGDEGEFRIGYNDGASDHDAIRIGSTGAIIDDLTLQSSGAIGITVESTGDTATIEALSTGGSDDRGRMTAKGTGSSGRGVLETSGSHSGFNGSQIGDGAAVLRLEGDNQATNPHQWAWVVHPGADRLILQVEDDGAGGTVNNVFTAENADGQVGMGIAPASGVNRLTLGLDEAAPKTTEYYLRLYADADGTPSDEGGLAGMGGTGGIRLVSTGGLGLEGDDVHIENTSGTEYARFDGGVQSLEILGPDSPSSIGSPQAALHVEDHADESGQTFETVGFFYNDSQSANRKVLVLGFDGTSPGGLAHYLEFRAEGSEIGAVQGNGSGGVNYTCSLAHVAQAVATDAQPVRRPEGEPDQLRVIEGGAETLWQAGYVVVSTGQVADAAAWGPEDVTGKPLLVDLARTAADPRVIGVLSAAIGDAATPGASVRRGVDGNRPRIHVHAAGDGAVWVTDVNGPVRNGDLVTSSPVAGYGQRQDDDLLHSYTVAKCTETVDWDAVSNTIDHDGQTVKRALVACTYHGG